MSKLHFMLARVQEKLGNKARLIELTKALNDRPKNDELHVEAIHIYLEAGENAQAKHLLAEFLIVVKVRGSLPLCLARNFLQDTSEHGLGLNLLGLLKERTQPLPGTSST